MRHGLLNLLNDLLSTIVFVAISLITGNDTLAIELGIATGIAFPRHRTESGVKSRARPRGACTAH